MPDTYALLRPLLMLLPPEDSHELALRCLELGLYIPGGDNDPVLKSNVFGLNIPNPIGIGAGFDKDARAADGVLGLGCGFAEIGTVTPRAQSGNPTPRVFRLKRERVVINRLGFNNDGHGAALRRLEARAEGGIVGVNIGANKDSGDRTADYVTGLRTFYDVASYFTVNVSSPNTPGLRDLQAPDALDELLSRLMEARGDLVKAGKPKRPVVLKLAPDIAEDDIAPIVARLAAHAVDGIAISNTTLTRPGLRGKAAKIAGGLSGRLLFHRSTVMLARIFEATEGKIPLIGIGGIDSGTAALSKIEAGASLIQFYTGFVYEGPGLIKRVKNTLAQACRESGVDTIGALTGRQASTWAAKPMDDD